MANAEVVEQPGWNEDIRGMLAPFTAPMMWRFNLGDYEQVRANATLILGRIDGGGMPPPPFPPLSDAQIQTFGNWVNNDCPLTRPADAGLVSATAAAKTGAGTGAQLTGTKTPRPIKFP